MPACRRSTASARSTPPSSTSTAPGPRCTSAGRSSSTAARRRCRRCAATSRGAWTTCRASAAASRARALGLGDPHWVDDAGFDVARHVHALTLAPPAGPGELRELAGALLLGAARPRPSAVAHVPRRRPAQRRLRGRRPGAPRARRRHRGGRGRHAALRRGRPMPPARLHAGALVAGRAAVDARRPAARSTRSRLARRRARRARTAVAMAAAPLTLRRRRAPSSPTPARDRARPLGHQRAARVALRGQRRCRARREAGRRHGATINDVLLAACTLALGRALRRRGERPATVKVLVPVNVRGGGEAAALGNRISFVHRRRCRSAEHRPDRRPAARPCRDRRRARAAAPPAPLEALAELADAAARPRAARRRARRLARGVVQRRGLQRAGAAGRARPARAAG